MPTQNPRVTSPRLLEEHLALQMSSRRRNLQRINHSKYTHEAVGKRIGVTAGAVYNWENGICYPGDMQTWQRWAVAIGMKFVVEATVLD